MNKIIDSESVSKYIDYKFDSFKSAPKMFGSNETLEFICLELVEFETSMIYSDKYPRIILDVYASLLREDKIHSYLCVHIMESDIFIEKLINYMNITRKLVKFDFLL